MLCPLGQKVLSQCGNFVDKKEGVKFFAILCGRILWTAPNVKLRKPTTSSRLISPTDKTNVDHVDV